MALILVLVGVVVGVVLASSLLLRWNEVRYGNGRRKHGEACLPPGTMGWPLFGETTEFLKQGPSFMKQRRLRWLEKNMESHPHFMLFGGGGRMCPGKEVGTAEIATFLHYFVTRYRWEEEGKNTILKFPRVEAPNGLHIRVQDY